MKLCSNRPEGFGLSSTLSSPIPTSCFVDTILIPLPVWLGLFFLPILFLLSIHHRKTAYDPSTAHLRALPQRKTAIKTFSVIYYILIICNILMQTLEIVRLELLHFGIGLLPFAYVGLILGALLHWSEGAKGRVRGWQFINAVFWVGGVVMCTVQVVGLDNEGIDGRKGSKYPISDQVIDVAVMAGVYAVVAILELMLGVWKVKRRQSAERGDKVSSTIIETNEFMMKDAGFMHNA